MAYFGSRYLGLNITTIEGIRTSAEIKQLPMEITTNPPKNFRGSKLESVNAINPTITDNALIMMPRPVVVRVMPATFFTLSASPRTSQASSTIQAPAVSLRIDATDAGMSL